MQKIFEMSEKDAIMKTVLLTMLFKLSQNYHSYSGYKPQTFVPKKRMNRFSRFVFSHRISKYRRFT